MPNDPVEAQCTLEDEIDPPRDVAQGTYTVVEQVGIGGFSRVYKAQGIGGEMVALKKSHVTKHVINPMLRHEGCALALLAGHPSVPSVYAWGRSQYYEYLVMDLLGSPLKRFSVRPTECFELCTVLLILVQMLDTIQHIHSRHLVHLDIKPQNIMFGIGGQAERVSLIDYGFTRYYRDPRSLVHRPLEEDQDFLGTLQYASLNAHLGFTLSRRDDLISLAYTIVSLLKGPLPWEYCESGTRKHREDRVREKKRTWTGARLCEGLPEEFVNFVDYVCGLEYEQQPDYDHWKKMFHMLLIRLGPPPDGCYNLTSSISSHMNTQQVQMAASREHDISANQTEAESPVAKGQYVLVQILPHLTIEGTPSGRGNDSVDRSRWHDPSLTTGRWVLPHRPALVLQVAKLRGKYMVSLLPLLHHPGELTVEQARHFICLGRESGAVHERTIIPSPAWMADSIYHTQPDSFRVAIEPDGIPVQAHWTLDDNQLKQLDILFAAVSSAPQTTQEAQSVIANRQIMRKRGNIVLFAHISPLTPTHASGIDTDVGNTSWAGWQGFVDDLLLISRRLADDNGMPWTDEEVVYDPDEDSSDDGWEPKSSWPAPQDVSAHELLGDEGEIIKSKVAIMIRPPLGSEDDLRNTDEEMVFRA